MKKREILESNLLPLNLQFFAEGGKGSSNGDASNTSSGSEVTDSGTGNNDAHIEQPTITQSQLNAIAAREKKEGARTGKKEVLKELGFKDEAEAKKAVELLNAMMKTQKSQEELNSEEMQKIINAKTEAEKRAAAVEAKLTILTNGVNADSVDDVLAIATAKVTDDKDLDAILKEMKKESRYASFFAQSDPNTGDNNPNSGTGSTVKNNNPNSGTGSNRNFGASLALEFSQPEAKKSSFFSN